jgi:hypothetical protein
MEGSREAETEAVKGNEHALCDSPKRVFTSTVHNDRARLSECDVWSTFGAWCDVSPA